MQKVYLIKSGDYFKIGYTKNDVQIRIKQLQTGNPDEIEYINEYHSENARGIERSLHNILSHKRVKGEYFSLDQVDISNFISLCERYDNAIKCIKKPESFD